MWTRLQTLMYLKKNKNFLRCCHRYRKSHMTKKWTSFLWAWYFWSCWCPSLRVWSGSPRYRVPERASFLRGSAGNCLLRYMHSEHTHTQIRLREVCLLRYKLGSRGFEPKSQFSQLLSFTLLSPRGTSRMSSPLDEVKYQSPYLNLPRDSTAEDNAVLLISHHS